MRNIFFSFVAAGIALTASAQQTDKQMATLQSGDRTTVFYGVDALRQAYLAAPDTLGVITLSAGDFHALGVGYPICKSVAIYGVGFERDEATGTNPTWVMGDITLEPANTVDEDGQTIYGGKHANGVHLEGLYVDGSIFLQNNHNVPICNLTIAKCRALSVNIYAPSDDIVIRQSQIGKTTDNKSISSSSSYVVRNLLVSNCHLSGKISNFSESSTIVVDHSILRATYSSSYGGDSGPYTYTNSILYTTPYSGYIAYNCVFVGIGTQSQDANGNWWYGVQNAGLWAAEGEDGQYNEGDEFLLKYPNKYVGNDGTQVGLHGGTYAWNRTPVLPRITECTIDTSDVPNGTLKVSIKAEAQTKE